METFWLKVGLGLAVLSGGAATAGAAITANVAHGQQVFGRCAACHKIGQSGGAMGPALNGIVGRKAGSDPSYRYSPALQNARITWNDATLAKFLEAPTKALPGTKMYSGLSAPQDRADVIAYMKQYKADGTKR